MSSGFPKKSALSVQFLCCFLVFSLAIHVDFEYQWTLCCEYLPLKTHFCCFTERPCEWWFLQAEYSKADFNWNRNVTGQLLSMTINITFLLPKRLDKGRMQAKACIFRDRTSNALSESVLRPLPAETRILPYLSRRLKGSSEGATQVSFETSELGMIFFQGRRIFFVPQLDMYI
jgi:hypothetical protein